MIQDRVVGIIAETLGAPRETVTLEAQWQDFEHDSLDLIELVIAIQEELEVDLDPKELANVVTIADLVRLVEARKSERETAEST